MQNFLDLSVGAKVLLGLLSIVVVIEGFYINHVMGGNLAGIFSSQTSCERVLEKWEEANPQAAAERTLYGGLIAPVDFAGTNLKQIAGHEEAITAAVAEGPNFAGKYAVTQWSCGEGCQNHAVVNIESGKIIAFGPQTKAGVGISIESPILIANPKENFPSIAEMQQAELAQLTALSNISREYYVLVGTDDSNVGLQRICAENPFEGMSI